MFSVSHFNSCRYPVTSEPIRGRHVSFLSPQLLSTVFFSFFSPNLTPPFFLLPSSRVDGHYVSALHHWSLPSASIIFAPRSYIVSISVDFRVSLSVLEAASATAGRSIWISTTSPSMTSVSSLMLTSMALRKAWVRASVFNISSEKSSLPASMANGVSWPSDLARPMAMAVLPIPG
jgi:hypothetical protein